MSNNDGDDAQLPDMSLDVLEPDWSALEVPAASPAPQPQQRESGNFVVTLHNSDGNDVPTVTIPRAYHDPQELLRAAVAAIRAKANLPPDEDLILVVPIASGGVKYLRPDELSKQRGQAREDELATFSLKPRRVGEKSSTSINSQELPENWPLEGSIPIQVQLGCKNHAGYAGGADHTCEADKASLRRKEDRKRKRAAGDIGERENDSSDSTASSATTSSPPSDLSQSPELRAHTLVNLIPERFSRLRQSPVFMEILNDVRVYEGPVSILNDIDNCMASVEEGSIIIRLAPLDGKPLAAGQLQQIQEALGPDFHSDEAMQPVPSHIIQLLAQLREAPTMYGTDTLCPLFELNCDGLLSVRLTFVQRDCNVIQRLIDNILSELRAIVDSDEAYGDVDVGINVIVFDKTADRPIHVIADLYIHGDSDADKKIEEAIADVTTVLESYNFHKRPSSTRARDSSHAHEAATEKEKIVQLEAELAQEQQKSKQLSTDLHDMVQKMGGMQIALQNSDAEIAKLHEKLGRMKKRMEAMQQQQGAAPAQLTVDKDWGAVSQRVQRPVHSNTFEAIAAPIKSEDEKNAFLKWVGEQPENKHVFRRMMVSKISGDLVFDDSFSPEGLERVDTENDYQFDGKQFSKFDDFCVVYTRSARGKAGKHDKLGSDRFKHFNEVAQEAVGKLFEAEEAEEQAAKSGRKSAKRGSKKQ